MIELDTAARPIDSQTSGTSRGFLRRSYRHPAEKEQQAGEIYRKFQPRQRRWHPQLGLAFCNRSNLSEG